MSTQTDAKGVYLEHPGTCPVCEQTVTFVATGPFFRSTLRCSICNSVPRHRVLMYAISTYFPQWKSLSIHEGSPGRDTLSTRLARDCELYTASQYDLSVPFGQIVDAPSMPCKNYQSENFETQTFADSSFDIVITQDVFEHIFHPDRAIKEVARTLKPGGATIMTVPIVRGIGPSRRRARMVDNTVENLLEPEYHGNTMSGKGSLVTIDWGYDIARYLQFHSGLNFMLLEIDNMDLGIRAQYNDVLLGFKAAVPLLP
jgi:SAM-dependent methyltransferase